MLFKQNILDGIVAGRVTLAFRRWRRPSVKDEGSLHTAVGLLSIEDVAPCSNASLTEADARAAGFDDLRTLRADLAGQRDGQLYRIAFRLLGKDPRVAVRENTDLSADQLAALLAKLARLDKAGAWTRATLQTIAENESRRAGDLAEMLGRDKDWLKLHIRKLKNLGLTESLGTGYRISPCGKLVLKAMPKG